MPQRFFEGVARLLPLGVLPGWEERVALDPVLDVMTPDAAPFIVGPHPAEIGEMTSCDGVMRTGYAVAYAEGRVEAPTEGQRVKPPKNGVDPMTYLMPASVEERDMSRLVRDALLPDGSLVALRHCDRSDEYTGLTASSLALREGTWRAQHIRIAAHESAEDNAEDAKRDSTIVESDQL